MRLSGRLLCWWDWKVYGWAYHSLRRMCERSPGIAVLIELHLREWTAAKVTPEVRRSAEVFFESEQQARRCHPDELNGELAGHD